MRLLSARAVVGLAVVLSLASVAGAQTLNAGQTLTVDIQPAGQLVSVPYAAFLQPSSPFGTFTAGVTVTSRVRTTSAGSGSIGMAFQSDFSGTGGPR